MKRCLLAVTLLLAAGGGVHGRGILIPAEKSVPPLAMLNHRVSISLEDQVSITKVEQTFRNHTARPLEATYVFPVPKGASVREFAMWVNDKRVTGELIPAAEARKTYTEIVRRTKDPGLLEYIGSDLLSLKVFPVPAKGDQKVELSYTTIARRDQNVVEYVYPLKTDGKATSTLEEFTLKMTLKSQQPVLNIYSPTHAVSVTRTSDREAAVAFEKSQALLDKDFQLFYTTSLGDVGLTALQHRPISTEDGYCLLLISPRAELSKDQQVPRDMVFVLDTSGSMQADGKIGQAKSALKHCLDGLSDRDRFGLINFSTTVNRYRDGLIPVSGEQVTAAKKWVDRLEATGGTAIQPALLSALELRSKEEGRTFTVAFFTDGKPTIGETNIDKILASVVSKNTASTRIFAFGVGHDLNAAFLDQLAEQTRAASTYVRPGEDMEVKVSGFFSKINHPVLANLRLTSSSAVQLVDMYPPQLPDLFSGDQLIVLARYQGAGPTALTLTGTVGMESRQFVYETEFLPRTEEKTFVEDLWARRKVGYLLDQIRLNGEKKELVEQVTALAKKYGITTPYTSFLIVPDAAMPVAGRTAGSSGPAPSSSSTPVGLAPEKPGGERQRVEHFARAIRKEAGEQLIEGRGEFQNREFKKLPANGNAGDDRTKQLLEAKLQKEVLDRANYNFQRGYYARNQVDKLGVDLAACTNNLKAQCRLQQTALRRVANRNCVEIGGVWIDESYGAKTPTVAIKAQSDAYFRILERQPQVREVFQLGNHLVWLTPNGTGLVVDTEEGKEQLSDAEIDRLFVAK